MGMLHAAARTFIPAEWRPAARVLRLVKNRSRGMVMSGPFKGLRYCDSSVGSEYLPKLLGTYERELHGIVEEICARHYQTVVNVGAAEGFYAVGLARRLPEARIVAFEMAPEGRKLLVEMAEQNCVGERIVSKGLCAISDLAEVVCDSPPRCLVIVDAEGAEEELVAPEAVAGLRRCDVLVEVHDFVVPDVGEHILDRFTNSHSVQKIPAVGRRFEDLPFQPSFLAKRLYHWHFLRAMDERRPPGMYWLWMKSHGR